MRTRLQAKIPTARRLDGLTRASTRVDADDGGYVFIMVALLIIPIMAFSALAVDVSSWYSRATELQRSADAGALAGVVWMPNQTSANTASANNLTTNGVTGTSRATFTDGVGSKPNSWKVCVTDPRVPQFFGSLFGAPESITRCATAQYNLPLQLGSPLNYFGGYSGSWSNLNLGYTPANYATAPPQRSSVDSYGYCDVNYNGTYPGYWTLNYGWSYTSDPGPHSDGNGQLPTCTWGGGSPIPPAKSTGLWAVIEGPATDAQNGDAYSPRCYMDGGDCTSQTNTQYRLDPSHSHSEAGGSSHAMGYWYAIDVSTAGPIQPQVFDGAYNMNGGMLNGTGDSGWDSTTFNTTYTVYNKTSSPLDLSSYQQIICQVTVGADAAWQNTWMNLCPSPINASAGDRYMLNIRTWNSDQTQGNGTNGYALRAVEGIQASTCVGAVHVGDPTCYGTGPQPTLSAYGDMAIYNNMPSGTSYFYLANVLPQYAGMTLVLDLYDIGDGDGNIYVGVRAPSNSNANGQTINNCTVTRFGIYQTNGNPGATDPTMNNKAISPCQIQSTVAGQSSPDNGKWLEFKIPIPSDYGQPTGSMPCNPTINAVNPTTGVKIPGSCWWQIYYNSDGQLHDVTTWSAHIEGDPARLIQ
ncbi:MAG: Tad domain-containing protein [Actinobacteria bacterium]|nr:Tad domain-containing protein [Actinomycetota bacterium]